jgi:hypothetical protein
MKRRTMAWSLCLFAGCGSGGGNNPDSGSPPMDSGTPTPATFTLMGALDGGVTTAAPVVGFSGSSSTFNAAQTATGGNPGVDVAFAWNGSPMAMTTYTSSSAGFGCNVTITSPSATNDTWVARYAVPMQSNTGMCSLTVSSETLGSQGYEVHGNLSVTAQPGEGGSAGMVILNGTF